LCLRQHIGIFWHGSIHNMQELAAGIWQEAWQIGEKERKSDCGKKRLREKNACYLHGVNLLSRAVMINLQSKQKQLVLNLISTLTDKVQEFINFIGLNSSCQ